MREPDTKESEGPARVNDPPKETSARTRAYREHPGDPCQPGQKRQPVRRRAQIRNDEAAADETEYPHERERGRVGEVYHRVAGSINWPPREVIVTQDINRSATATEKVERSFDLQIRFHVQMVS